MKKSFKKLMATTFASVALCFTIIGTSTLPLISGITIETEENEKGIDTTAPEIQPLADDEEKDKSNKR